MSTSLSPPHPPRRETRRSHPKSREGGARLRESATIAVVVSRLDLQRGSSPPRERRRPLRISRGRARRRGAHHCFPQGFPSGSRRPRERAEEEEWWRKEAEEEDGDQRWAASAS